MSPTEIRESIVEGVSAACEERLLTAGDVINLVTMRLGVLSPEMQREILNLDVFAEAERVRLRRCHGLDVKRLDEVRTRLYAEATPLDHEALQAATQTGPAFDVGTVLLCDAPGEDELASDALRAADGDITKVPPTLQPAAQRLLNEMHRIATAPALEIHHGDGTRTRFQTIDHRVPRTRVVIQAVRVFASWLVRRGRTRTAGARRRSGCRRLAAARPRRSSGSDDDPSDDDVARGVR